MKNSRLGYFDRLPQDLRRWVLARIASESPDCIVRLGWSSRAFEQELLANNLYGSFGVFAMLSNELIQRVYSETDVWDQVAFSACSKALRSIFPKAKESNFSIYALNYNLLRIMSGLGGLHYEN